MLKRAFTALLITFFSLNILAQDLEIIDQNLIWIGATVKKPLENDWQVSLKLEERRFMGPDRAQQRVLPNIQVSKKISSRLKASAGLWVFTIYGPADPEITIGDETHEWRPHLNFNYNVSKRLMIRLKSELRLFTKLGSDHHFAPLRETAFLRERIRLSYRIPFGENTNLSLSEEVHLNAINFSGSPFRVFDQNRLVATLRHQLSDLIGLKLGYLYWFQPTGAEASYFGRHIIQTGINFTLH